VQIVASDRQDTERKIAESKKQLDDLNRALNERNFDINPIEDKVVDGRIDWRGKVLETDGKLTKVSLGRNHKIKVGDELHVYRLQPNPEYLGRLKVINVEADQTNRSLCEFTPARRGAAIRTNDIVATGMPGRETTQSEAIALKHGNAGDVAKVIQELFVGPKGDSQRIRVTFDASSNALIVQASPTDLGTIRKLIDLLDQKASKTLGSNRSGATDEKELDRDIAIAQERLAEFRDMAKSLETAKSGNKEQLEDRKVKLIEVNQLISDLETQLRELDRRRELLHMVRALRAQGRDEEASAELLNVARAASLPPAGKDVPKLDGQWKGASGEWVIAGDRLFIHRGGEITVAKLALGKRGGYNSIDITLDTNVIHHGVYAVTDDRLTVYLLDRSTPGDSRKTTDFISLTFDRHQKSTKPADPFHR